MNPVETCAIAAPFAKARDLFARLLDPRARLWGFLDTWAGMDEAAWLEANVQDLYGHIVEIFRDYPEAEAWFGEWRATHPAERLV